MSPEFKREVKRIGLKVKSPKELEATERRLKRMSSEARLREEIRRFQLISVAQ